MLRHVKQYINSTRVACSTGFSQTMLGLFRRPVPIAFRWSCRPLTSITTPAPGNADIRVNIDLDKILFDPVGPTPQPPRPSVERKRTLLFNDIPPAEDPLLHFLASSIMRHGRRHTASKSVNRMLLHLHAFTRVQPLPILREAIRRAAPSVKVITMKSSSKNTLRPSALSEKQRTWYAIRWILKASEKKNGRTVEERLARELISVLKGDSEALRKKTEFHQTAMVSRGVLSMR